MYTLMALLNDGNDRLLLIVWGMVFHSTEAEKEKLVWYKSIRAKGTNRLSEPYLSGGLRHRGSRYLGDLPLIALYMRTALFI